MESRFFNSLKFHRAFDGNCCTVSIETLGEILDFTNAVFVDHKYFLEINK
jgi:hypothetical protein